MHVPHALRANSTQGPNASVVQYTVLPNMWVQVTNT